MTTCTVRAALHLFHKMLNTLILKKQRYIFAGQSDCLLDPSILVDEILWPFIGAVLKLIKQNKGII